MDSDIEETIFIALMLSVSLGLIMLGIQAANA